MNKKYVIRFLKERRRGAYSLLVKMYAEEVTSLSVKMALVYIKEDQEKESKEGVELHYFSLAKAISRFKKKAGLQGGTETARKWKFKDSNEIESTELDPGRFKMR